MRSVCLTIPARLDSSRLPRKILLDLKGKSLIRRVWEVCKSVDELVDEVVILVDDEVAMRHVLEFGAKCEMTSRNCLNGTERVAEFARRSDYDFYLNIQGDDPTIPDALLRKIVDGVNRANTELLTVVSESRDLCLIKSPNSVKVALDASGRAIYFSRFPIPFIREKPIHGLSEVEFDEEFTLHTGVYGYSREMLNLYSRAKPSRLEVLEGLEQLRFISLGQSFSVIHDGFIGSPIDVQSDIERALRLIEE